MLESSSATRQIVLLLLVTGLFLAAWSMDGGHQVRGDGRRTTGPPTPSRSAIATLLHSTACRGQNEAAIHLSSAGANRVHAERPIIIPSLIETPVEAPVPLITRMIVDERPVEAPTPFADSDPVVAPIPVAAFSPVEAPLPTAVATSSVRSTGADWTERVEQFLSRTRMNYRISGWHCRQRCNAAERRIAAAARQARRSLDNLAATLSQAVQEVVRNAQLPGEATGESRRF